MPRFMRRFRRTPAYKSYRRNRRRYNRSRRNFVRRNRKYPNMSKQRSTLIADRMFVPLKYTANGLSLSSTLGSFDTDFFMLNSPVDSSYASGAGTTVDAYGFNQWSAFYRQYVCYGSSISCRMSNFSATTPSRLCITPITEPLLISSSSQAPLIVAPYARYKTVAALNGGMSTVSLNNRITVRKIGGVNKIGNQDGDFVGDTNWSGTGTATRPPEQFYWVISAETTNGSINTLNIYYDVVITYWVEFFDRQMVAVSN